MQCSFCKVEMEVGTGKMLILSNGKFFHYCSMKCEKNHQKLGRDPRKFKWANPE
ncbi:MAG: 50S ribosomal protein L24e [Candidatus Aenigmarchaeota archaeon]|nr:50S ribosomal protein L24e [Candidatus Aenigmarchaeota archaeon]